MVRRAGVARLVCLSTLVWLGLTETASAHPSRITGNSDAIAHQGGPQSIFKSLRALSVTAIVRGKRILTSPEVKRVRRIGTNVRKGANYLCKQWADYFRGWPYYARNTAAAIRVWGFSRIDSPAGRAYRLCRSLAYIPIILYG